MIWDHRWQVIDDHSAASMIIEDRSSIALMHRWFTRCGIWSACHHRSNPSSMIIDDATLYQSRYYSSLSNNEKKWWIRGMVTIICFDLLTALLILNTDWPFKHLIIDWNFCQNRYFTTNICLVYSNFRIWGDRSKSPEHSYMFYNGWYWAPQSYSTAIRHSNID